jgi:hypothetical protein
MKKVMILSLTVVALFTSGCVSTQPDYFKSVAVKTADLDANATAPIAIDFMDFIAAYHPAAMTTFLVDPVSKSSNFLSSMEAQLRQRGYGMTYDKGVENAIPLAWKADPIGTSKTRIRVTFNIGSGNMSRQYILNQDTNLYVPIGMFTIRDLGKRYYDDLVEPEHQTIIMQPITEPKEPQKPSPETSLKTVVVDVQKDSSLHIRKEATTDSKILGKVKPGSEIVYKTVVTNKKKEDWIKLEKGIKGYVAAQYVKPKE